jgi:four helix bundle protein
MTNYRELQVFIKAYDLAMKLFKISKTFPEDERFGLVSQVRRSSRAVCSNIVEGYRKRRYPAHFISKLTDADMENSETMIWIEFALSCGYIDSGTSNEMKHQSEEIGRLLNYMINNPKKFT